MGNNGSSLIAVDDGSTGELTAYAPHDMHKMIEYLPDFVHPYHSTKANQATIVAHWNKLFVESAQSGNGNATAPTAMLVLFDKFYEHLFELVPEARPLFRSSMQVQGKALIRIVGSIKNMLQSPNMIEFASELAARHVEYGIKLTYFNGFGLALLRTLQTCSEELWTPEIELAWKKVYAHVALIVLTQLNKRQPSRRRPSMMRSIASHDGENSQLDADHLHQGLTLDVNATCPVSGNSIKRMPQPAVPLSTSNLSKRVLDVFGLGASARYQQE